MRPRSYLGNIAPGSEHQQRRVYSQPPQVVQRPSNSASARTNSMPWVTIRKPSDNGEPLITIHHNGYEFHEPRVKFQLAYSISPLGRVCTQNRQGTLPKHQ